MVIPDEPTAYVVEAETLRLVGPLPALVLAVLMAHDSGDGSTMSHRELAYRAGITYICARRCIDKLSAAGLLKAESQHQDFRRQANRYQFPTSAGPAHPEQGPAHHEQGGAHSEQALSTTSTSTSSTFSTSPEEELSAVLPTETVAASLREPVGNPPGPGAFGEPGAMRWPEPGSPMPVSSAGRQTLPEVYEQSRWLVVRFAGLVLERQNQEHKAKGWKPAETISQDRRERWLSTAVALIGAHPLAEVNEVVDFVFGKCGGNLPQHLVDHQNQRKRDRKVTRLQQICDFYTELRSEMGSVRPEPPKATAKPKVNYGEPLSDPAMEAQVQRLVKQFGKFRSSVGDKNPDQFRTWGWAKTFRIALSTKTRTCSELLDVIRALKKCRCHADVNRYQDAIHLMAEGEWPLLLRMVDLAEQLEDQGSTDSEWGF